MQETTIPVYKHMAACSSNANINSGRLIQKAAVQLLHSHLPTHAN